MESAEGSRSVREWFRHHWLLDRAWRIVVFIVGVALVCLGVVLLILPGPGWAMIALGLVVLASEFVWAKRFLAPIRARLRQANAVARDPRNRRKMRVLTAVGVFAVCVLAAAYVRRYGLTLDGARALWPL